MPAATITSRLKHLLPVTFLKTQRDILFSPARSLMLVVALAVGVFALGTMLGAMTTLRREMARNYGATHPATATLRAEDAIPEDAVGRILAMPGVEQAELRRVVRSRMTVGNESYPVLLFVIRDFGDVRLNRMFRESGDWPPPTGTMLVERTALRVMHARPGDSITVRTPHGQPRPVAISGIVHDPGLAPAWQEQTGYGYITAATLRLLGEEPVWDELRIQTAPSFNAQAVATSAASRLTDLGIAVHEIQMPPPGRHPHQGQMEAVLTMFLAFSLLTLTLSAILTTAAISTLMVRQTREIGIMKASGAKTSRFVQIYVGMIAAYALMALAIAVPASRIAAHILTGRIAILLNLEIADASAPLWTYFAQAMAALAFPVLAALWPVWRSSQIAVRDALDYRGTLVRLPLLAGGSLPLPLRNALRNPSRLLVSTGLLAVGGALFMSALNVTAAWKDKLADVERFRLYDVEVRLAHSSKLTQMTEDLRNLPGIRSVETWTSEPAAFFDGSRFTMERTYPDQGHGSFSIITLPPSTQMVRFPVLAGRWLRQPGDRVLDATPETAPEAVINHVARDRAKALGIDPDPGSTVRLTHGGIDSTVKVVGIVEDIGSQATVYVASQEGQKELKGETILLRFSLTDRSLGGVTQRTRSIEGIVDQKQIPIDMIFSTGILRNAVGEHMTVLISTLTASAILMATVGFLGLVSTMTMNIVERTRELGIMRAIGGRSSTIRRLLILEGAFTVAGSLPLAFLLSLLLSWGIGSLVGSMAFRTPLPLISDPAGLALWSVILAVGTILSVMIPVRRALRVSTRQALAYDG